MYRTFEITPAISLTLRAQTRSFTFILHEYFKAAVWRAVEALDPPVTDSTFQIPFRPSAQLKLLHLTTMVNVTEALFLRYMLHDCSTAHPELAPGADAGALQANNSFVPGTPNAGIDAAWRREAANLPNNPVSLKFRNCR